MEIRDFILIIAMLANFGLGIIVFLNRPNNIANRLFALFAFSLVFWIATYFFISLSKNPKTITFLGKLAFSTACFPPPLLMAFFIVFPKVKTKENIFPKLLLIFLPTFFFALMSFTNLIQEGIVKSGTEFKPIYGPLFPYFALYILSYILIALTIPIIKYRIIKAPYEKLQLQYVLTGLIILTLVVCLNNIFFPVFTGFSPFFGLSRASTVIPVGLISYAIIRYRFMDISIVIRNTVIYSLLVVICTALLFLLLVAFKALSQTQNTINMIYSALLISILIAFLLPTMRGWAEAVVGKYIFKGHYSYQKDLKSFSKDLANLFRLPVLEDFLVNRLIDIMQVESGKLVLFDEKLQVSNLINEGAREFVQNPAIEMVKEKKDILVKDELKRSLPNEEYAYIVKGFDGLKAVVIIPLIIQDELIGFIGLGEKKSGDIFSLEDISFLSTLGNQAAVAIQNAKHYNQILEIKEYNEKILEQMSSGVITIDKEMQISTFNKRAQDITRIPSKKALGNGVDVIQTELSDLLIETLKSKNGLSNVELSISIKDKTEIPINVSTGLLKEPPGEIIGAFAVITDLTGIKQLEAEVRRAERLATLGTLAAGMAHEIKNPLVSLKTFSQLLPTKYDDPEFRDHFSQIASQEVDRIDHIVEQLLRFARPSKPAFMPIDVQLTIEETLTLLASELSKNGIRVEKQPANKRFLIFADKEQLKQVFLNIILNAIDATSKNSRPRVSVSIEIHDRKGSRKLSFPKLPENHNITDNEVIIKITDNGIGILKKDLNHIFDPFFTTKDRGHGLGLSIAHGIIKEHRGKTEVQSRPGESTTFSLSFPVIEPKKGEYKDRENELLVDRL